MAYSLSYLDEIWAEFFNAQVFHVFNLLGNFFMHSFYFIETWNYIKETFLGVFSLAFWLQVLFVLIISITTLLYNHFNSFINVHKYMHKYKKILFVFSIWKSEPISVLWKCKRQFSVKLSNLSLSLPLIVYHFYI